VNLGNLESILQLRVRKASDQSCSNPAEGDKQPTSIRLKPETKNFLECQATALNTSTHSLINTILDGVAEASLDRPSSTLHTIRKRFFDLFDAHKLNLPDIISVMRPYGFTLSVLDNQSSNFFDLLDQKAFDYLASTFSVQKGWLIGASESIVSPATWYKDVHSIARKLIGYSKANLQPHVMFIRRSKSDFAQAILKDDPETLEPIGAMISLCHKTDDGVSFKTLEVLKFERWNYWRCRKEMKLLICFCGQANISHDGYEFSDSEIKTLTGGRVLPIAAFGPPRYRDHWNPEEYASYDSKVVREVDEWPSILEEYKRLEFDTLADLNSVKMRVAG
jgi:hypothetical protein